MSIHRQRDKQNITHTHIVSNIKKSGMLYMNKLQKRTLGEVRQTLKEKHILLLFAVPRAQRHPLGRWLPRTGKEKAVMGSCCLVGT